MPHEDEFKPIEEMLAHANPNPKREGCPSMDSLKSLALRQHGADDPLYVHVSRCSPCYTALRELQREHGVREAAHPTRWFWGAVAAAILLSAVAGALWYSNRVGPKMEVARSQIQALPTVLDLRPFAVVRSEESLRVSSPLAMNRGRQKVLLVLPVASEAGEYSLTLLDGSLAPQVTSNPSAKLIDGVTSMSTELDLSGLSPGRYTLALKREPEDWRYFPVLVR